MAPADATAPPLPNDVLVEIFLLLPAKSALRFRAVSKPWCHLLYDPAFIRERHRRAPGAILLDNPTGAISALPFPRTDQSMAISLYCGTASLDTFLHGCCDGLLLLSRSCFRPPAELGVNGHRFRYFVCNPATREFAGLPVDLGIVIFVGFYLHAPTAEYRVLCYRSSMVARHLCDYLVAAPGQNRARKLKPTDSWSWTLGDSNDWRLDDAPAIHRGCLHWMLRRPSMGLVVFDTISEEFRRMRGPVDGEERTSGGIIVVDGTLGASLFAEGLVKVWVLVNYEDEAWNLRYSIELSFLDRCPLRWIRIAHVSEEGDAVLLPLAGEWYAVYNLRRGEVVTARHKPFRFHATSHVYKESLVSLTRAKSLELR